MSEPDHQQVLQFVQENSRPFVTTADVSNEFDSVTSRTIRQRLNELEQRDDISVKIVGAESKVWYIEN